MRDQTIYLLFPGKMSWRSADKAPAELEEMKLFNLPYMVLVIVQWGLPPEQLATERIRYKSLSKHQDGSFSDLAFPDRPKYAFSWIEPGSLANILTWWSSCNGILQAPGDLDAEKLQLPPPSHTEPSAMGYGGSDI
ncbi:hypothetical protein O9K51_11223 [Purpureocillium lavendulum]|uniref:Uncharacterized protein n=1 Tax=Purpureocillium lavendulum TaxID=1247861 RepID=A0AB34FAR6_9HYPO|nr:hypothetical protein O9K51_11223 [Purpureocillium lavendulum]